ncbi:MAG TPA: hypothetical protein VFN67_15435 [Polyangiales bacterium]|nr:hypothetical protein [Polyangiales bacterium]
MTARAPKLLALMLSLSTVVTTARAEDAERPPTQFSRHELWLSWSATLLLAGIAGSFALKAAALDERVEALPRNVRERPEAQEDAVNAWRWTYGFGSAASLMAVTSVLVWIYQPALPDQPSAVTPVVGVNQVGLNYHGRF